MKKFIVGVITTLLLSAVNFGLGAEKDQPLQTPQLSAEYGKWRDHVLPKTSEQSSLKIAWRASVLRGIVDAQRSDKPVMILLMNGHPLGCT